MKKQTNKKKLYLSIFLQSEKSLKRNPNMQASPIKPDPQNNYGVPFVLTLIIPEKYEFD